MTQTYATRPLPANPDETAPDGSEVRVLLGLDSGGMAHFTLASGETSTAVTHKTISEIWYVLSGYGEMWRKHADQESVIQLVPGLALTIPVGTTFQFRSTGEGPLTALGQTMPPWPGDDEAIRSEGIWEPTVPR